MYNNTFKVECLVSPTGWGLQKTVVSPIHVAQNHLIRASDYKMLYVHTEMWVFAIAVAVSLTILLLLLKTYLKQKQEKEEKVSHC